SWAEARGRAPEEPGPPHFGNQMRASVAKRMGSNPSMALNVIRQAPSLRSPGEVERPRQDLLRSPAFAWAVRAAIARAADARKIPSAAFILLQLRYAPPTAKAVGSRTLALIDYVFSPQSEALGTRHLEELTGLQRSEVEEGYRWAQWIRHSPLRTQLENEL